MSLAAFFQTTMAAAPPFASTGVNILYRASDLTQASVTTWPNAGTAGATYDLAALNNAPLLTPRGSAADIPYVHFVDSDGLVTVNPLAIAIGDLPRTVGLYVYREQPANTNFAGYGSLGNRRLFDVMSFNSSTLFPHYHGGEMTFPPLPMAEWTLVEARYNQSSVEYFLNGASMHTAPLTALDTDASALHVGEGAFSGYNAYGFRLSAFYLADRYLSDEELVANRVELYK